MTTPAARTPRGRSHAPALPPERDRLRLLLAAAALPLLGLTACERDPGTGPAKVRWDRDTCARCNMVVGDRHYAAQVRGGPERRVHLFDDIGCAMFWLEGQAWAAAPETEIWVTDQRTGEWLDATRAHYVPGRKTPMYYGFGAVAQPVPGAVDYADMRARILARGR